MNLVAIIENVGIGDPRRSRVGPNADGDAVGAPPSLAAVTLYHPTGS
jgi:hypothetical protein